MNIKYICNGLNKEQLNNDDSVFKCLYSCIKKNNLGDKLLDILKKGDLNSNINIENNNLDNILENINIEKTILNEKLLNIINDFLSHSINEIKKENKKYIKINDILLKKINIILFQDNINDYITRFNNENLYLADDNNFFDIVNPNLLSYGRILKEKLINKNNKDNKKVK